MNNFNNNKNITLKISNKESMYMFLSNKNKFNKYSATVKFYPNNENDMAELENLKQQYSNYTNGGKLNIKDRNGIKTLEVFNMFNNFTVFDKDGNNITNNENIFIPFDSKVNLYFEIITTKNGGFFPALKRVDVLEINEKNNDNNFNDNKSNPKSKEYIPETSEIIKVDGKLKEVFTRGNEKYYYVDGQKIEYKVAPKPQLNSDNVIDYSNQKNTVKNTQKATTNKYENRQEPPLQSFNEDDAWYNQEMSEEDKELSQLLDTNDYEDELDKMIPF